MYLCKASQVICLLATTFVLRSGGNPIVDAFNESLIVHIFHENLTLEVFQPTPAVSVVNLNETYKIYSADSWYSESSSWSASNDGIVTTQISTHRKVCTQAEEYDADCMNGGRCFALEISPSQRIAACSCASGWTGKQCEMRELSSARLDFASTAGITIVVIFFALSIFVAVVVIVRKRCYLATRLERTVQTQRSFLPNDE